jgi:DNA-binding winged helix-turn-helix (wHTH) protein
MNQPDANPTRSRIIRFGLFEADLKAGELSKNGLKIKLQEQPFRVLSLLLERAGELVTREELREQLWSTDTFVDFEHSLNTSVKKLRQALGDSADNPRFVETLARRGYRFIVPVEQVAERLSKPDVGVDELTTSSVPLVVPAHVAKPEPLAIGANGEDPTISRHANRLAYVERIYNTDIWRIEARSRSH